MQFGESDHYAAGAVGRREPHAANGYVALTCGYH